MLSDLRSFLGNEAIVLDFDFTYDLATANFRIGVQCGGKVIDAKMLGLSTLILRRRRCSSL